MQWGHVQQTQDARSQAASPHVTDPTAATVTGAPLSIKVPASSAIGASSASPSVDFMLPSAASTSATVANVRQALLRRQRAASIGHEGAGRQAVTVRLVRPASLPERAD
jgi:hypothetical protein